MLSINIYIYINNHHTWKTLCKCCIQFDYNEMVFNYECTYVKTIDIIRNSHSVMCCGFTALHQSYMCSKRRIWIWRSFEIQITSLFASHVLMIQTIRNIWVNDWISVPVCNWGRERESTKPLKRQHDTTSFTKLSKSQQMAHTIFKIVFLRLFLTAFYIICMEEPTKWNSCCAYIFIGIEYNNLNGTIRRTHIVLIYLL